MRIAISIVTLALMSLASTNDASAKCMSYSLRMTPKHNSRDVPLNVEIFVTAYGHEREKVATLLEGSFLYSGKHKVRLEVQSHVEQSKESYRNVYLTLKPLKRLKRKRTYRLFVPKRKVNTSQLRWIYKLKAYRFRTGKTSDKGEPSAPKLKSSGFQHRRLGCGPAINVPIEYVGADDKTPSKSLGLLLHFDETSPSGTRKRVIRLGTPYAAGKTMLGHGMCSGNFKLVRGARYTIRLSTIDWAGNVSKPSSPITATAKY
jgi:hypothetical protein